MIAGRTPLQINQWYHIAVVRSNTTAISTFFIFINGSLDNYSTAAQTTSLNIANVLGGTNVYPPAAMTANQTTITGQSYGNGEYVASASSFVNIPTIPQIDPPYLAFNKAGGTDNNIWGASAAVYNSSSPYNYIGTVQTITNTTINSANITISPGLVNNWAMNSGTIVIISGTSFGGLIPGTYVVDQLISNTVVSLYGFVATSTVSGGSMTLSTAQSPTFTTIINNIPTYGEYLDILLPNEIILTSYSIQSRSDTGIQAPGTWYLLGTNNGGSTWTQLDNQTAIVYTANQLQSFSITNSAPFKEYRIVITAVSGASSGYLSIAEMYLYGSQYTNVQIGINNNDVIYQIGNFTGFIDEVRVTNGIARYTANFVIPQAPFPSAQITDYTTIPNDNLYTYTTLMLPLNGNIIDYSIYSNTLSVGGITPSITYSSNSKFAGKSFSFNGTTVLRTSANKTIMFGADPFTIEFWMNPSATQPTVARIMGNATTSSYGSYTWAITFASNVIGFIVGTTQVFTSSIIIPNNSWTHVAIVKYTSTQYYLYINGVQDTSFPTTILYQVYTVPQYMPLYPPTQTTPTTGSTNPVTLTLTTTPSYGNGSYTFQASSLLSGSGGPQYAFAYFTTTMYPPTTYTLSLTTTTNVNYASVVVAAVSSSYTGSTSTTVSGTAYLGEWIDIVLPFAVVVNFYTLSSQMNFSNNAVSPYTWILAGSNNGGSTWTLLDNFTAVSMTYGDCSVANLINNTTAYNKYRIIATSAWLAYITGPQGGSGGPYSIYFNGINFFSSVITYPPVALTGNISTISGQSYGNGTYTILSSSGINPYIVFDKNTSTVWQSGYNYGSTSTNINYYTWGNNGAFVTSYLRVIGERIGNFPFGASISITLPYPINVVGYYITAGNTSNSPTLFSLYGSNDGGNTYTRISQLGAFQSQYFTTGQTNYYPLSTTAIGAACYSFAGQSAYPIAFNQYVFLFNGVASPSVPITIAELGLLAQPGALSSSLITNPIPSTYATGGIKTGPVNINGINYYVHTFTTVGNSTFTVTGGTLICDILVVAGGGGAGYGISGGGGAGGFQYFQSQTIAAGLYTVTVGAGGPGNNTTGAGTQGGNSQFGALTASIGGGYGCNGVGGNGGSGGSSSGGNSPGSGTSGQGYAGGSSVTAGNYPCGGGGGAGSVGGNGSGAIAGNGGVGLICNINGVATYYAGGGGGGINGGTAGTGGLGGGGNGTSTNGVANSGVPNTGGGGGGTGFVSSISGTGGSGGSGIVILRYKANISLDGADITPPVTSYLAVGGDGAGLSTSTSGYYAGLLSQVRLTRYYPRYLAPFTPPSTIFPQVDTLTSATSLNYYYGAQLIVSNWITRIAQAGGTISALYAQYHINFVATLLNQNIWQKIYRLNTFSGDQLTAALVPLKITPGYGMLQESVGGSNFLTYNSTGSSSGILGDSSTNFIDTSINLNTITSTGKDLHMGLWIFSTSATGVPMGVYSGANPTYPTTRTYIPYAAPGTSNYWGSNLQYSSQTAAGLYLMTNDTFGPIVSSNISPLITSVAAFYVNGTQIALTNTQLQNYSQPSDWSVTLLAMNGSSNGLNSDSPQVITKFSNSRIGIYTIGSHLLPQDQLTYYRAMNHLNTVMGRT